MNNQKHLQYIDIAKGIAIIAVVIGHCFPDNFYSDTNELPDVIARVIYDFCYSWHMPTFFFLSGFLFYNSWESRKVEKLGGKVKRLLIPYLSFSILYIPLRLYLSNMANSEYSGFWKIVIGISPNGGVWYLYVLFVFMVLSMFLVRNTKVLVGLCILGSITNAFIHMGVQIPYSVAKYVCLYYVFFALGLLVQCDSFKNYYTRIIKNNNTLIKAVVFFTFFIMQEVSSFEGLNIICGLTGIQLVISISKSISSRRTGKIMGYLGVNSMPIYLLHGPILIILRTLLAKISSPPLLASAAMAVGGLIISIGINKWIISMSRILNLILFGIDFKKEIKG